MPRDSANEGYRKKRERLILGCEGCRARHVKCDTKLPRCFQCTEGNIECVREPNIRFRNLHEGGKESDLSFPETQTWIPLENSIQFHDETPGLVQIYRKDAPTNPPEEDRFMRLAATFAQGSRFHSSGEPETVEVVPADDNDMQPISDISHSSHEPHDIIHDEVNERELVYSGSTEAGYTPQHTRQYSAHTFASPLTTVSKDTQDVVRSQSTTILLTDREAVLIRNFIENMALWADITDLQRHFEIEVPRRALHQPVLRLAICAFSSRHMSRNFEYDETEALQYHNECVQCLIPKLSGPSEELNEDVLAAISILRQYEEMDEFDNRCHLIGTTKLLNSISKFGSSGGLGEAAAWLCLRQDIYVSLVSQQPLKTYLENYHNSKTFQRKDDVSLANQMVFLLAKVLSYAFLPDQNACSVALQQIDCEVDEWYMEKPATFTPIRFIPRSREHNRAFPEVWLLSPFHVVALQYYHIAKLVLAVSIRQPQISGYENLRQGRKIEKCVHNHLLMILGLAASNRAAENILFTARHTLSVWGGVLRDELERECTVSLLLDMEKRTGWRAAQLINSLNEQWNEDIDND